MGIPKRKNNLSIYSEKQLVDRRQELLDRITKSDSFLPDSILHDDLDGGMLEYVKNTFKVVSDGVQIPVIDKILTIQRWGEITNTWTFVDEDRNIKLPFIGVVRKPEVQLGTNPSVQRTIPDRHQFYYASVPTWNGTTLGADIYKIPQPIPVDINYDVTITCNKFRDLNKFNKIVLQNFASRQDYTTIKGHYIPIVLDSIQDGSPIDTLDGRRFYIQTYKFTMLGFLIDSDEFEVKPAISRMFLMNEFIEKNKYEKKYINKIVEITVSTFVADGTQTIFNVGETITELFLVTVNGLVQQQDVDYYFIPSTTKVTFAEAPVEGSIVTIVYYKSKNNVLIDVYGNPIQVGRDNFTYDGSTLVFDTSSTMYDIVALEINGLVEVEGDGFEKVNSNQVRLLYTPVIGSRIGLIYLY